MLIDILCCVRDTSMATTSATEFNLFIEKLEKRMGRTPPEANVGIFPKHARDHFSATTLQMQKPYNGKVQASHNNTKKHKRKKSSGLNTIMGKNCSFIKQ